MCRRGFSSRLRRRLYLHVGLSSPLPFSTKQQYWEEGPGAGEGTWWDEADGFATNVVQVSQGFDLFQGGRLSYIQCLDFFS